MIQTITIGEYYQHVTEEDMLQDRARLFRVPGPLATEPGAVNLLQNEITIDARHWESLVEKMGLGELFFDPGYGLLCAAGQAVDLRAEHQAQLNLAWVKARADLPAEPMAYLVWLKHWVEWALLNCARPVISNR